MRPKHLLSVALGALTLVLVGFMGGAAPAAIVVIVPLFYSPIVVYCFTARTLGSFVKQVLLHGGLFALPAIFWEPGFALRGIPLLTVIGLVGGVVVRSIGQMVRAR